MSIKSCSTCNFWIKPNYSQRCAVCTNFSDWKSDPEQEISKASLSILDNIHYDPTPEMPKAILSKEQEYQLKEMLDKKFDLDKQGKKFDLDKADWTLMPWKELQEVLEILEFGAKKYSRDNWKHVEPARYEKAAMRHLISYVTGEKMDSETNKSHLAHLICNALFLMWNDNDAKVS